MAAGRHGVSGVDREIENSALEFIGVDFRRPQIRGQHGLQMNMRAQGAVKNRRHPVDERIDVEGLRIERLNAGKRQQPANERRRAIGAVHRRVDQRVEPPFVSAELAPQYVEARDDDAEHVVEVMRNAAGEMAERFELLRLAKLRFERAAFGRFSNEFVIGKLQVFAGFA